MGKKPNEKADPMRTMINNILFEDKMPEEFILVYKVSMIMGSLFEPLKMGENFSNLYFQIARLFNLFGKTIQVDQDEIKTIYMEYVQIIAEKQKQALAQLEKNMDKIKNAPKSPPLSK